MNRCWWCRERTFRCSPTGSSCCSSSPLCECRNVPVSDTIAPETPRLWSETRNDNKHFFGVVDTIATITASVGRSNLQYYLTKNWILRVSFEEKSILRRRRRRFEWKIKCRPSGLRYLDDIAITITTCLKEVGRPIERRAEVGSLQKNRTNRRHSASSDRQMDDRTTARERRRREGWRADGRNGRRFDERKDGKQDERTNGWTSM